MKTSYPLQWIAGLMSNVLPFFIKQNRNKVVLTSFHGDGFRGNTKVIFEHLSTQNSIHAVWLTRNRQLVEQIKSKFGDDKAELMHSFSGLVHLASSSAILFTHGTSDYPFLRLPRRALILQTYHGLPTKRGEYLKPKSDNPPNLFHRLILKYRFKPIDYFLSTSPFVTDIFSKRFGLPKSSFIEIGFPSYDKLQSEKSDPALINRIWPAAPDYNHILLYSPTFRKFSRTKWFPFQDLDFRLMADFLEKEKILILIRPHPNERVNISEYQKHSPRFLDASQNRVEDIYELLPNIDLIVTDYSSIYLEGLLRDIPSVFIPYDLESYERGLPFDYEKFTPGDKVRTQKEFLNSIRKSLDKTGTSEKKKNAVLDRFFSKQEKDSTKKVGRFLEAKLLDNLINS